MEQRQQMKLDIEKFEREPTLQSVRQASALRKQLIDDAVERSAAATTAYSMKHRI